MPTKSGKEYQSEPLSPLQRLGRAVRHRIEANKKFDMTPKDTDNAKDNDPDHHEESKKPDTNTKEQTNQQGGSHTVERGKEEDYNYKDDLMQQALHHKKRIPLLSDFKRYNQGEDYQHRNALESARSTNS